MRKFQKKQLLDIFRSMHMLHQESKEKLERKEFSVVQNALADCQEAAIQMGEFVEQLEGEGADVVVYLEQYCEWVYQLNMQLQEISPQKYYKKLEEILVKAENALSHISIKKEIVFFPYKASMWDSLESVYLKAKEDENCEVYCVPIPYYDRRADGSLGMMHYEGNEYPKNIEIMDYRNYNLEERHPDEIYIHNPYDGWNTVTCVPEKYFAKNLCNHTDKLVYIPYFVLGEIEPDDQDTIDGIKHFCFVPGVIYAHEVIVQSENMRQIYINEYIKAAKTVGLPTDRKVLEKKIIGTGSPKYEKILRIKKQDLEIPDEWLKIIKKPDGSWKKVIFYNTSINGLLRYDGQMIEKMKDVFRIFKEQKDEVALLWRPHPLIQSTIESMRPQLWESYCSLVKEYCSEGWGIYDDSQELDRAVILCDAYYGDKSSVVQLCEKVDKEIMIQNPNVVEQVSFEKRLAIGAAVIDENKLFFSVANGNGLFCYNFDTKELEFLAEFQEEQYATNLFFSAQKYHDYIIFIPFNAKNWAVYDLKKRKVEYYDTLNIDSEPLYVMESLIHNRKLYLFTHFIRSANKRVIVIDLDSRKTTIVKNSINMENNWKIFVTGMCRVENMVYAPIIEKPYVMSFNLETYKFDIIPLQKMNTFCTALVNYNNEIWASECSGKVYCYNSDMSEMLEEYAGLPEKFQVLKEGEMAFKQGISSEKAIFFIPARSNHIIKCEPEKKAISLLQIKSDDGSVNKDGTLKYGWVAKDERNLYAFQQKEGKLYIIDLESYTTEDRVFEDKWGVSTMYRSQNHYYEDMRAGNRLNNLIQKIL